MITDGLVTVSRPPRRSLRRGGHRAEKGVRMQGLIVLGILVFVGYSLYRSGKRTGSRKGYYVGRSRRRW